MIDHYDSNQSRREFLRRLSVLAPALVGAGGVAGCASERTGARATTVNLWGTGTLDVAHHWTELRNWMGIEVEFEDNLNDPGPILARLREGEAQTRHVSGLQGGAERELAQSGSIIPWDLSRIPNYESLWPWAKEIPYTQVDEEVYGIPAVLNADSIIYLPERTGGVVDSYSAVFDPEFRGRASMEDAWINSVVFAAIYLKENQLETIQDPANLHESELRNVMSFLREKAAEGQFRKLWRGWEDGVDLITSEEVWVMTGWEPIVLEAVRQGVNAAYAVPREGYEGWSNDLLLHPGARLDGVYDAAHKLVDWELGGYYGAALAELRGYVVPTDAAVRYAELHPEDFNASLVSETVSNVRRKFFEMKGNVYFQNVRPDNHRLYDEEWRSFRQLFG